MSQNDYTIRALSPLAIELDAENPRLHPEERGSSQDELRLVMLRRFKINDLGQSIVASGYIDLDPIIGYQEGNRIIVREGNRRVAALQLLLDPNLAPTRYRSEWQALSEKIDTKRRPEIEELQVRVYASADEISIDAYIGFRHVSGILEWPAEEKARFITNMVDTHGWSYQEIAQRIGSYPKHVERHYIASRFIEQAIETRIPGAERIKIGVLLRALQAGGISDFLGISYPGNPAESKTPVVAEKEDDLRFFVEATFGSDEKEPILPESRALTKWGRILQSAPAIQYLKTAAHPGFERAWIKSGGEQETVLDMVTAAADNLEDAMALLADYRDNTEISDELFRCARRLHAISRDFPRVVQELCGDDSAPE